MKCTTKDATFRSVDAKDEKASSRNAIALYWEQPVVWAGLSYAFLNSNVMCFGGAMTTYLLSDGMPVEQVGLLRGLSSAVGLAGTFAYKFSANRTTVVNTGAWSIVYLFSLLTVACLSFLVDSAILLVISAALSRIGLWVFDYIVYPALPGKCPRRHSRLGGRNTAIVELVVSYSYRMRGHLFQPS